jgi:hypothetical protein
VSEPIQPSFTTFGRLVDAMADAEAKQTAAINR